MPFALAKIRCLRNVDCFECQVWSRLNPKLGEGPSIIISNNYEHGIYSFDYRAKSFGISRKDTLDSARIKCPSLIVFKKSDNNDEELARTSKNIQLSIKKFIADELGSRVQLRWEGFEEGYLNIADEVEFQISNGVKYFQDNYWKSNTKWINCNDGKETKSHDDDGQFRLRVGVNILAEILRRLELDTGLIASGSIGCSKIVARLACPLNKPRGITVVTYNGLEELFTLVEIKLAPGLKGKTGQKILNKWKKPDGTNLETLQDLKKYIPLHELTTEYIKSNNKDAKALIMTIYFEWIDPKQKENDTTG